MQHGDLSQNAKSEAQDMLCHANVRFVARHIPEQLPSGLNCPCFFMDIENYSQLFCHASGSRFWKIRISNVICISGDFLWPLGATAMRRIVPAGSEKQGRIYPVVDACAGTPLLSALSS